MEGKYVKRFRFPGWLFLIGMSLYVELLLYIWTGAGFVPQRLATILVFGLAFGCGLGFITNLLPQKAEKWLAVILGFLMAMLCLVEFFIHDAFSVFMPLISVFATAEGVATGYTDTVIDLLLTNLWRIGLVLLPVVLYAVFSIGTCRSWKRSLALAVAAAALYAGGIGLVRLVDLDTVHMSSAANFDGTVKSFGLSMGTLMDLTGGAIVGQSGSDFEIIDIPQTPVETTAPAEETTAPAEEAEPETIAPTEPPKVYLPHSFDLDFIALAEAEPKANIANIHRYLATLTPDMENDYTGLFEGKNLILITAEAFSHKVIDPELTPTLYRMATEGIRFTDYYHQLWGCGTTGGEFANLLSIVPYGGTTTMMEVVQQDMFLTMGNQLQKRGYVSGAFHNNDHTYYNRHKTHTELGYDIFYAWGNGMEKEISNGWTRSDEEMFQVTLPQYLEQDQPFSLYYMTVSGHSTYAVNSNTMAKKNYELVKDQPYSEYVRGYLACNMDLELAMAYTVAALEEAGIAEDTVIVISTDHYPYGLAPSDTWGSRDYMAELYGPNWNNDRTRDRNALIIWSGCLEDMDIVVEEPVSALDILPTMSNLFGLEYDSRLLVGRDVFSDSEPLVFWPLTYSWKTDKGFYDAKTGQFTPAEGVEVTEEYIQAVSAAVKNKTVYSRSVQYYDYFNVISKLLQPVEPTEATE
jgi:arylsulfatase A-like enzyme/TRAP-type C4-dicarboxylate transport system permease small subunit